MTIAVAPPPMVKMASGKMVRAARPMNLAPVRTKRFLIVLQYYEGDRDAAEELVSLITDLERTRNREADFMLMRRADARELSTTVRTKLETKFEKVLLHTCRRTDARGYPWGPNAMFFDLVTLMAHMPPYRDDYYAFLNLETDAVPLHPGWIGELIKAWREAQEQGWSAMGHIHDNPVPHLNGLAVYAADIWRRVGSNALSGGNPQVAYDVWHAPSILPLATHTPLIVLKYRQPTITARELYAPTENRCEPAIFHGVKDGSARRAVRERHITRLQGQEVARANVYTYFHQTGGLGNTEEGAILTEWRKGWISRGWNPVTLSLRDAMRHPQYAQFDEAISRLPTASANKDRAKHQFIRWLALDVFGGGLLTDYDVLPETFTPVSLGNGATRIFRETPESALCGMFLNRDASATWVNQIISYDAQPDDLLGNKPHVIDDTIARKHLYPDQQTSELEVQSAIVHFHTDRVKGERKSAAMEKFLRGP